MYGTDYRPAKTEEKRLQLNAEAEIKKQYNRTLYKLVINAKDVLALNFLDR